jgi:diaminopimelate decarboxylase
MNEFNYHGDEMYCEGIPVQKIVSEVGTPCYLYSRKTLENHFEAFDSAFAGIDHLTCYSVKANSNLAVLKIFAGKGSGVDVVSGGEIFRALQAGIDPGKIVYSGVGKSREEIEYALNTDILMYNVESSQELDLIDDVAEKAGKKARIALRVNPDVDPKTHPYISTGMKKNKFGIRIEDALNEYRKASGKSHIDVVGVDCHIGSQITEVQPFADALERVKRFVKELLGLGISIKYLDVGGGLGITYENELPPAPSEYASVLIDGMGDLPCTLILEPGRVIVGNAGILVSQVMYVKKTDEKHFIIVDAAMNDLVRPSLYDAYHAIQPVKKTQGGVVTADIVGPICESGDFMARDREMPDFTPGDYVALMSSGAYGFTMSSNYNSRPRAPEVLVDGDHFHLIRARESYNDLIRGEKIPEHLSSL